jgi:hypothetical protein
MVVVDHCCTVEGTSSHPVLYGIGIDIDNKHHCSFGFTFDPHCNIDLLRRGIGVQNFHAGKCPPRAHLQSRLP